MFHIFLILFSFCFLSNFAYADGLTVYDGQYKAKLRSEIMIKVDEKSMKEKKDFAAHFYITDAKYQGCSVFAHVKPDKKKFRLIFTLVEMQCSDQEDFYRAWRGPVKGTIIDAYDGKEGFEPEYNRHFKAFVMKGSEKALIFIKDKATLNLYTK